MGNRIKSREFGHWAWGILVAAGIFVGTLLIVELLFDPLSWLRNVDAAASIYADLLVARERWQSQEIAAYTIDAKGSVPLACLVNATLTVREGQLIAVEDHGGLLEALAGETAEGVSVEPEGWDTPLCSYKDWLVPEMYAQIERELNRIDWSQDRLEVSFDPEYGYVTEYRYDCCYRRGILSPVCSDCNVRFSFSNFEPMTDP